MSSVVEKGTTRLFSMLDTPTLVNCAQEQEINDLFQFLKLEYRKNIQYKFILNILEEYIQEENDDNLLLKDKIRNIILSHRVSQTLILDSVAPRNNQTSLLGIQTVDKSSLTYLERNTIQAVLKAKLEERKQELHKTMSKFPKNANNIIHSFTPSQLSAEDRELINTKQKLILEQEQYVNNLMELQKLLLEIAELRLKTLPNDVELKIKHSQAQEQINSLKALFTEDKFRVDTFTETNYSLQAYKELLGDIKSQQSIYQKEIQELEKLKEKYRQVSCKQFDEILVSYKQYKSSIEQKKKMYEYLLT